MPDINPKLSELSRQPELTVGAVLGGKYQIDGVLGSGGMGVVLSATHLELGAPVAIKVVQDEFARNEEVVGRMLFEARAAAKLRSSHVVRVMDVARLESGAPYIVMEHLTGRDLAALLIERGALPVQEAVDYLLQTCEGLAEAHAHGIIHRDLKPENLFLASTPEGVVVKILDFGISKEIGTAMRIGPRTALTNAGCAVGSPYYMSPEQMRASDKVDTRADIWSLGAILFELLIGRCPFDADTMPLVCASVLNDPTPSLRSFSEHAPPQLDAIVQCCLQKDAALRFESVAELAAALREFASVDGQRSMDRSARLASGINLRGDGRPLINAVGVGGQYLSACSSPSLPSFSNTPALGGATASAVPVSLPTRKSTRWGAVSGVAAAITVLVAGVVVWQRESAPAVSQREPGAVSAVQAVPAPEVAALTRPNADVAQGFGRDALAEPATALSAPTNATAATKPGTRIARPARAKIAGAVLPIAPLEPAHKEVSPPSKPPAAASDIDKLGGRY